MRLSSVVSISLVALVAAGCADRPAGGGAAGAPMAEVPPFAPVAPMADPGRLAPPAAPVDPATIPVEDYVRVDAGGRLVWRGQRMRFWGAIGQMPKTIPEFAASDTPEQRAAKVKSAYADVDAIVQRLVDLGFNMNRTWQHAWENDGGSYTLGDGSRADLIDYYYATMKRRGLFLWGAGINDMGVVRPADAAIIDEPATEAEWKAAIEALGGKDGVNLRRAIARRWDPRLEAIAIERRARHAGHFNKHTGLRYADDPVFAAWELSNEEWWIGKMVRGEWMKLPPFFQKTLTARWNQFLRERYRDDAGLTARWKALLPGESLAAGTVQLAPLAGPQDLSQLAIDEQAKRQLLESQTKEQLTVSREKVARERGEDVTAFFVELHISSKRREAEAFKSVGRSTRLSPLAWDTGIGYEIQSQWLHQNADFVSHDAYINGWGWGKPAPAPGDASHKAKLMAIEHETVKANAGLWNNWLLKPPGIAQGVPWLEHNRTPGKPYLAYETQICQPAKYRADYPLRLAALASIQDWDGVAWHYFDPPHGAADPQNWVKPTDNSVGRHAQGYHYTFDEVQMAQMRTCGLLWRQGLLRPAANPTTFIYGRRSLYDPTSMDYGHSYGRSGLDMMYTTYQHGVRILIDPTREDDEVRGAVVSFDDRHTHNPYTPTREITFDWKLGHIRFDAPGAVGFAGLLARVGGKAAFANGITLDDVAIANPPGSYDPVSPEEGYLAFTLTSEDGRPLAETRAASLALTCTSFNTGFAMAKGDFERAGAADHPLAGTAGEQRRNGTLPVLVSRVAATVRGAPLRGMSYVMYDWTMKPIGEGKVQDDALRIPSDKPIFFLRLTR